MARAATFLACKFEEFQGQNIGRPGHVLQVFNRMDARREGNTLDHLQNWSNVCTLHPYSIPRHPVPATYVYVHLFT